MKRNKNTPLAMVSTLIKNDLATWKREFTHNQRKSWYQNDQGWDQSRVLKRRQKSTALLGTQAKSLCFDSSVLRWFVTTSGIIWCVVMSATWSVAKQELVKDTLSMKILWAFQHKKQHKMSIEKWGIKKWSMEKQELLKDKISAKI